jgi:hypothetical protein
MKVGTRFGIALGLVLAIGAIAAIPAGANSTASKSTACSLSAHDQRHLGASYVYTLKVKNLSCDKAKNLVKAYHECRHANGGADGTCSGVSGYSCNEKILDQAPTQFSAKATCKKGSKKFKQTFGENT